MISHNYIISKLHSVQFEDVHVIWKCVHMWVSVRCEWSVNTRLKFTLPLSGKCQWACCSSSPAVTGKTREGEQRGTPPLITHTNIHTLHCPIGSQHERPFSLVRMCVFIHLLNMCSQFKASAADFSVFNVFLYEVILTILVSKIQALLSKWMQFYEWA